MENNKVTFDSEIGKEKKSNKGKIIAIIAVIVIIIGCAAGYYIYRKMNITEISIGASDIELTDELMTQMQTLASDAEAYYNENKDEKTLTSQYGLLYSYSDKVNIMASDVKNIAEISKNNLAEMDILYVMPNDIVSTADSSSLSIFVSLNSNSGYYVTSADGQGTMFTAEEFKNLLMKYAPTHGNIINPQRGSEEHTSIITAAGLEEDDVDIKHIACDDKYAIVVANYTSSPSTIREIALINDNGWSIINDNLAASENSYIEINEAYPDIDLGLLPIYNIADFGEIQTAQMSSIVESLVEQGMLTEDEKVGMYACGCDRFAYIHTEGGRNIVGYIDDDKNLAFYEFSNVSEVISYMLSCQDNPPVFIAIFE